MAISQSTPVTAGRLIRAGGEIAAGEFVGQSRAASVEPCKLTVLRGVMQGFFHDRVRQTGSLLHEVNAQYGGYLPCGCAVFVCIHQRLQGQGLGYTAA